MAKKRDKKDKITLRCTSCKEENYHTSKNRKNTPDKLNLNKFCPVERKVTVHAERK